MPHPISFGDKVSLKGGKGPMLVVGVYIKNGSRWFVVEYLTKSGRIGSSIFGRNKLILLEKAKV